MMDVPQGIEIRTGVEADLAAVQKLNAALYEYESENGFYDGSYDLDWTYSESGRAYFERCLDPTVPEFVAFLAEAGGTEVGYLAGRYSSYVYRTQNPIAEIDNMCVIDVYRRTGVGTQLVTAFREWARDNGVKRLRVAAFAGNDEALGFYESCGFSTHEVVHERRL